MAALLQLENIETYYDLLCALRGVSLVVEEGSITTILGNNGAGKTTILNTVMGLIDGQPDKGAISFDGKRIDSMETEAIVGLGIGYVPGLPHNAHNPITKTAIDFSRTPIAKWRIQFFEELKTLRKVALRLGYLHERGGHWIIRPQT